ncbi:hypothetical protein HU830_04535 [Lactobacillus sp. DCY120]|uniref:Uncharacterized protein n=1 Tax=Bombilactobacillus apium TaxID=2675299 RepID=A0A850R062_9LACO|nr:hypothetical protein [Bombilactobacillus apium]NVY96439.1 hypothetical protein [Bombilactobacillus apium]
MRLRELQYKIQLLPQDKPFVQELALDCVWAQAVLQHNPLPHHNSSERF